MNKVKAVILPAGGQSYNPSGKEHQQVINQVLREEIK